MSMEYYNHFTSVQLQLHPEGIVQEGVDRDVVQVDCVSKVDRDVRQAQDLIDRLPGGGDDGSVVLAGSDWISLT